MRVFLLLLALAPGPAAAEEVTLTTVQEVRILTPARASQHLPVRLRGIVTFVDPVHAHAFVQDRTGGTFFVPGRLGQPGTIQVQAGDEVEITGVTRQGKFSPSVAGDEALGGNSALPESERPVRARRLGHPGLPSAPMVALDEAGSGLYHDQLVRLRGTLRSAHWGTGEGGTRLWLRLSSERGEFGACLPNVPPSIGEKLAVWMNREMELRGVVTSGANAQGQLRDSHLSVPGLEEVTPDLAATDALFQRPPQEFREVLRYDPRGTGRLRTLVRGVVALAVPGRGAYLAKEGEGLWVQSPQEIDLAPGDEVEAAAVPAQQDGIVFLKDGILRVAAHRRPPAPSPLAFAQALAQKGSGRYVVLQGTLLADLHAAGFRVLYLSSGGKYFGVRLAQQGDLHLPVGGTLQVRGVLENATETPALPGMEFSLLAGSKEEIEVLQRPAWLNAQKLRWLAAGLGTLTLLAAIWVQALRRQVARQTGIIEQQVAEETLTEERQRMARELHDTLEQQLAGVQFQLDAVADWLPQEAGEVGQALGNARAMLEHTRVDARRSVWELRSQTLERAGLVGALHQLARQMGTPEGPRVEIALEGVTRRLARPIEFQLLRIAQESVGNALKHARAQRIVVTLRYEEAGTELIIADDGLGFDPASAVGEGQAHFGLLGMRERAGKVLARLEVSSRRGEGATISVRVPAALLAV